MPEISKASSSETTPLLSIITPVFHGADTLELCIQSVLALRRHNIEHIIIDGGSGDDTTNIIQRYHDQLGPCISEPDKGVYDAMNKGVRMSSGLWLLFMGADDLVLPPLKRAMDLLKERNSIYYANVLYPNAARIYRGKTSTYRLMLDNISHQCILYPRSLFDRYQFDLKYPILADHALNIKCMGDTTVRFHYLPLVVAVHSDTGGLSNTMKDEQFISAKRQIIKESLPYFWYCVYVLHKAIVHGLEQLGIRRFVMSMLRWTK